MTHPIITKLAKRLGKSEDESLQFFQILWQIVRPSPETPPYFFRYLDQRFLRFDDRISSLRQEMLLQIENLQKGMQQGDANLAQQIEGLRKETQHLDASFRQAIEALQRQIERLEKIALRLDRSCPCIHYGHFRASHTSTPKTMNRPLKLLQGAKRDETAECHR